MRTPAVALLLLAALARTAPAQTAVRPAGVATTVVALTAPAGVDSVDWRVVMADGFRLFAPSSGGAVVSDAPIRLPLTFGVPRQAAAGPLMAGRVVATWSDGTKTTHPFSVEVLPRYELRFWLGAETVTPGPRETVTIGYRLGNRGNAVDTVRVEARVPQGWTGGALPERVVLAAGDTALGTITLVPGDAVVAGADQRVGITAQGLRDRETRSARIVVVGEERWFGDLASVPSTVFLGSTTGMDGLGAVAVEAAGEIQPGTRMSLVLRRTDQPLAPPAFRQQLAGSELRFSLERRDWRATGGDVYTRSDLFTGASVRGTGVDAAWTGESRGGSLLWAVPSSRLGTEDGHVLRAEGYVGAAAGELTAIVSDLRRESPLLEGFGLSALGLRYRTGARDHGVAVQLGAMRVSTDSSGSRVGPSVQADYHLRRDRSSVTARLRAVPATTPRTAAYGDELSVAGTAGLAPRLSALGWGYLTRSRILGQGVARSTGAAAGVRYDHRGGAQLQLTGNVRDTRGIAGLSGSRRSLTTNLEMHTGPLTLELDGEWGHLRSVIDTMRIEKPFGSIRAGARWYRSRDWAWIGLSYRDEAITTITAVDLAGLVDLGRVEIQGGLTARLDVAVDRGTALWTGTTIDLSDRLAATIGVDYDPAGIGDAWRFSLGLTRSFALPLPVRREPAAYGLVYEDRNGNRARDPGEPAMPGLTVRLGILSDTTDQEGRFRFMESGRGGLRLDAMDLPIGVMVPADVHLPATGYVEIPVVRTASLQLFLFLDRDGDGERDGVEDPADGVVVSIVAADGRTRDVAANVDGIARAGGLSPGEYTIRIHRAGPRGADRVIQRTVSIPAGGAVSTVVAIPLRQREIRMKEQPEAL